jgi:hypothetical protein
MDQLGTAVDTEVRLHAELPLIALFVSCISGSRALSAFLVENGAVMIVASTIVPVAAFSPCAARCSCTWSNSRWPGSCGFRTHLPGAVITARSHRTRDRQPLTLAKLAVNCRISGGSG